MDTEEQSGIHTALDHFYRVEAAIMDMPPVLPQQAAVNEALSWLEGFLLELLEQTQGEGAAARYFIANGLPQGQLFELPNVAGALAQVGGL